MKKIVFINSLLGVVLLATACGSDKKEKTSKPQELEASTDKTSVNGSVDGPCALTGDIRSFEITGPKNVQTYSFVNKGVTFVSGPDEKLRMENTTINGVKYDMNIEAQGNKIIGSEKLASKIDLVIDFEDSSTCSVSVWAAD